MRRILIPLLLIFFAVLVLVLKWSPAEQEQVNPEETNLGATETIPDLEPDSNLKRSGLKPTHSEAVLFIDKITGDPIDIAGIAFSGRETIEGEEFAIAATQLTPDRIASLHGTWEYQVPSTAGNFEMAIPLNHDTDLPEPIPLPWSSSLTYRPLNHFTELITEATVEISFPNEEKWAMVVTGQVPGEDIFTPKQSIRTWLSAYELNFEKLSWTELLESDHGYSASGLHCGKALLRFQHPIHGATGRWIDLSPGDAIELEKLMLVRPVFFGQVFKENGKPAPNAKILADVHLHPEGGNESLKPGDGNAGRGAFGVEGNYTYFSKHRIVTDENGVFEVDTPIGIAFALEAYSSDGKAFAFLEVTPSPPGSPAEPIELTLIRSQTTGPEVRCVSPEGNEVSGLDISFMIAGDPWARSLPSCQTDAESSVHFPWLPAVPATLGIRVKENPLWKRADDIFLIDFNGSFETVITIPVTPK